MLDPSSYICIISDAFGGGREEVKPQLQSTEAEINANSFGDQLLHVAEYLQVLCHIMLQYIDAIKEFDSHMAEVHPSAV